MHISWTDNFRRRMKIFQGKIQNWGYNYMDEIYTYVVRELFGGSIEKDINMVVCSMFIPSLSLFLLQTQRVCLYSFLELSHHDDDDDDDDDEPSLFAADTDYRHAFICIWTERQACHIHYKLYI